MPNSLKRMIENKYGFLEHYTYEHPGPFYYDLPVSFVGEVCNYGYTSSIEIQEMGEVIGEVTD